mgnify:CR=1 FL=1
MLVADGHIQTARGLCVGAEHREIVLLAKHADIELVLRAIQPWLGEIDGECLARLVTVRN